MSDIVSPLLEWLNANPEWASLVTFLISAGESVAVLGTIVPGSITMTAIGTLAGAGVIPLWTTLLWAILGAIVGDGISYWVGHYFKDRLRRVWPFRNNPGILKTGEMFVHKYGVMSVFFGRFVGPVRALVPLVAGMLGMRPLLFTIANVTSAIGWAPAYMLPGIMLGAASLELPPDIALHVILVLFFIALFFVLCIWTIYKVLQLIHSQTDLLQIAIWDGFKNTRFFSPITVLLKHHDPEKTHGQLTTAFYFLLIVIVFALLAFSAKWIGPANISVNDALFHLFRGITVRSDKLDVIMINITLLGQKEIVLPVIAVLAAWYFIHKRYRAGLHIVALAVLGAGSVFVIKHIFQSPRPWGIIYSSEIFSMPSGHTTMATTFFIGLAFLMTRSMRRYRSLFYGTAILLSVMVAISRLYLGAHWFTDIICAWLLSAGVLLFFIISYQREEEKPLRASSIFIVAFLSFVLSYSVYHHQHAAELRVHYTQLNWPTVEIDASEWWEKNNEMPAYQVSLYGFPSQSINVEWVGDLENIRDALTQEGWSKPPARDWISTLHRITGISSSQFLPMISQQYLDKRPALILTRKAKGEKGLIVIRLWDSNRVIKGNREKLWVGTIAVVPRSYSWLFKKHPKDLEATPALVFPTLKEGTTWQWKSLVVEVPADKHIEARKQKILLIK